MREILHILWFYVIVTLAAIGIAALVLLFILMVPT